MTETKHSEVYALLKGEILGGKYGKSRALPSEMQLSRRCACSRTTVRKAMDELRHEGLVRSRQGKGVFVTERAEMKTFGLILPGVSRYEYFNPIALELVRIAQREHCAFLFVNIDATEPKQLLHNVRELAADFIKRRVSGVIYHPVEFLSADDTRNADIVSVFRRAKIPVVLFDSDIVLPPARSGHDVVSIDNALAAESLASHLLAEGARNVHVAMLPRTFPNQMERVRGVASAVVQSGRPWSNARNVLRAEPTDVKAIRAYMKRRPRPDAFACQNDAFAADFAQTLRTLGYAIPKDVMIGGFDGMDIARVMALTTIQQPYAEIAQTVFDRLLHRVERPSGLPVRLFLPERLVVRASTQRKTKG